MFENFQFIWFQQDWKWIFMQIQLKSWKYLSQFLSVGVILEVQSLKECCLFYWEDISILLPQHPVWSKTDLTLDKKQQYNSKKGHDQNKFSECNEHHFYCTCKLLNFIWNQSKCCPLNSQSFNFVLALKLFVFQIWRRKLQEEQKF